MFSLFSISHSKDNTKACAGFGLIELLVSISIMVIIVSIVLVRQSSFNGSVLLRSQAYEVALQLRDIQLTAVSATAEAGDFRSVIGAHFDTNAARNGTYRIFRDADDDNYHDTAEEFGLQGLLDERFEIRAIREGGTVNTHNTMSIVFERPDFDARFFNASGNELSISSVEIDIARKNISGTGNGVVRTVEVTTAGQISVQ